MTGDSSAEFRCLGAITEARSHLDAALSTHAAAHFRASSRTRVLADALGLIRSDNAHNIARFFYVAQELGLLREQPLRMLIERHNRDMDALLADRPRADSMGLLPQRIEEAKFSPDQIRKLFEENDVADDGTLPLDQSDMAKLFSPLMSAEICRQTLLALAEAGLLKRTGRGRIFITSPGILEQMYRDYLALIVCVSAWKSDPVCGVIGV
jgi:hypothetical protein